mgnify:CR=1 FL=1
MQFVDFFGHKVSKLIVGDNPFNGHSYIESKYTGKEMKEWYTAEKVLELYEMLGKELSGRVAVKVHSGEKGNQNFLRPSFWKPVVDHVGGTVVECNTAYDGGRNTTAKHLYTLRQHGWSTHFDVDLLDAEGPDLELPIPNGKTIQKNFVGKDIVAKPEQRGSRAGRCSSPSPINAICSSPARNKR